MTWSPLLRDDEITPPSLCRSLERCITYFSVPMKLARGCLLTFYICSIKLGSFHVGVNLDFDMPSKCNNCFISKQISFNWVSHKFRKNALHRVRCNKIVSSSSVDLDTKYFCSTFVVILPRKLLRLNYHETNKEGTFFAGLTIRLAFSALVLFLLAP